MPWTTALIPPQAGRRALVTGATSGIGYEAAPLALAGAGAEVVIAARDAGRAEASARAIRRAHPGAQVGWRLLDTGRLASVRAFADGWRAEGGPIDLLLLNAGIAAVPRREETEDGFERQFATNYLGHFALTGLLLPHMRSGAGAPARVVAVASIAHRSGVVAFDDLQRRRRYGPQATYRQTKLAMLISPSSSTGACAPAGSSARSLAAHPGLAATEIARRGDRAGPLAARIGKGLLGLLGPVRGARRPAAPLRRHRAGGRGRRLLRPGRPLEIRGDPGPAGIALHARDPRAGARLWAVSEALTGVAVRP